ncbi:MAG: 23S rRNA (pseudouridine(1915)-N(3))-methyltransferase RlmH, partial [Clostridiales Family XIII bacterium]|nr:23S rRNA (pseudouridine(1915)-N(3))-methyltransferase RlmH [Clostridiales Family XIII bacterium]
MNIEILCIGSLKERYFRDAESEYLKRLAPYCKIKVTELRETRLPQNAGEADEEAVRAHEGETLLAAAEKSGTANRNGTFLFALDPRGRGLSSEAFAARFSEFALSGKQSIIFLIGGSLGFSDAVRKKADTVLSFSEMTFPHQLMRIIL